MLVKMVSEIMIQRSAYYFYQISLVAQQPLHKGAAQTDDILDPNLKSGLTSQNFVLQSDLH